MKIEKVTFVTSKLEEMKSFYTEVMRFPLKEENADSFTVEVGQSLLSFAETTEPVFYHFAFAITESGFDAFLQRIMGRAALLPDSSGELVLHSNMWKGRQIYFEDPERNILEVLSFPKESSQEWLAIQEVGMPSDDVHKLAQRLDDSFANEFASESDTFRFYGDREGVFVLVKERRHWFPTDRPARIHPIHVEAALENGNRICFTRS
ncbi:MAG: VOC family protein [Clostridia bacterium]